MNLSPELNDEIMKSDCNQSHEGQDASKKKQNICSTIFSIVWITILIVVCIYFFTNRDFKRHLLRFAKSHGHLNTLSILINIIGEAILLMLGGTASIIEIISAFLFKNYIVCLIIAIVARQIAGNLCFFIGRYAFRDAVTNYLQNFKIFKLLVFMLNKNPFRTVMLFRFAFLPTFIQYYGLPALGASFLHINISIFISSCIVANLYLLPGYLARSEAEVESGDFQITSKFILLVPVIFYLVMLLVLTLVMRSEMKKMQSEEESLAKADSAEFPDHLTRNEITSKEIELSEIPQV